MTERIYHIPVLGNACVDALITSPDGVYVDATFGGGGHSRLILERLSEKGRLIAFDQDTDALANAPADPRLTLVNENFCYLKKFLRLYQAFPCDGILADFGVSSHQIDAAERGFTFRQNAPLDMRMDNRQGFSAATLLNEYEEDELSRVFRFYGELPNANAIARRILVYRHQKALESVNDLRDCLSGLTPRHQPNKFLARVFQALRIEVNKEMEVLERFLLQTPECLREGGRLVTLSYHSLEDRPVKNLIRSGRLDGKEEKDFFGNLIRPFKPVVTKAGKAEEAELEENPRARSARLRIGERLA